MWTTYSAHATAMETSIDCHPRLLPHDLLHGTMLLAGPARPDQQDVTRPARPHQGSIMRIRDQVGCPGQNQQSFNSGGNQAPVSQCASRLCPTAARSQQAAPRGSAKHTVALLGKSLSGDMAAGRGNWGLLRCMNTGALSFNNNHHAHRTAFSLSQGRHTCRLQGMTYRRLSASGRNTCTGNHVAAEQAEWHSGDQMAHVVQLAVISGLRIPSDITFISIFHRISTAAA